MAGNVLMVKHAANVPQSAIAFERLWIEAEAPAGLCTNLLLSHDQANQIVDDPRIKGVAWTGSAAADRSIAARAGQNLKPSSLELGGSDAFIVLEDADLDDTIKWAVWGLHPTHDPAHHAARQIAPNAVRSVGQGVQVMADPRQGVPGASTGSLVNEHR